MHPNQKGVQSASGPGLLCVSMSQPKRIIEAFTPAIASSAAASVMPVIIAITTIISEAESEYSTQRKRFRRACSSRRYLGYPHGDATSRWKKAESSRNAASAGPMRSENSCSSRAGSSGPPG